MTEKNGPKLIKPTTTPINIGSVTLSKVQYRLSHLKQGTSKLWFISLHTLTLNWLERRSACRTPLPDGGIWNVWSNTKSDQGAILEGIVVAGANRSLAITLLLYIMGIFPTLFKNRS